MVMKLNDRNEIKVYILYLMHYLNRPMKYEDIAEVVVQDEIVGGLDFADCFADLLEAENIRELREGEMSCYELTPRGKVVVDGLQEDIPKAVRSQGMKSAFRLLAFKERGSKISANYTVRDDGKFDLCCRIVDNKQLSLEIKIVVESAKQLELMIHNFDDRPEIMYRGVLALLCGDMEYLMEP